MMLMPLFGVSINILSLFAFIMVLGIVVDDAIVIGGVLTPKLKAKVAVLTMLSAVPKRVATPATFGVLTTIAVFAPFTLSSGPEGTFFYNIAVVVILCLAFSLVESKLILPAHLAHTKFSPVKPNSWRARFNKRFFAFVNGPYKRSLAKAIEWRWAVLMMFVALLMLSMGLIGANYVRMVPNPKVPHDFQALK